MGEYRIDDLAREAGTTVRNVRAYQERGLLDAPRREGRVALYDDAHLARLRLILKLLERGATLALIGDLVDAWHEGHNIADLLGLEAALLAPGTDEPGEVVSIDDLSGMFGIDPDADLVDRAVTLGLLTSEGDGYRVLDPRLVQIATDLASVGVPVEEMLDHVAGLRQRVQVIADDFVDLAIRHVFASILTETPVTELASSDLATVAGLVQRLRPLAKAAVDIELTRALDAAITSRAAAILAGEPLDT